MIMILQQQVPIPVTHSKTVQFDDPHIRVDDTRGPLILSHVKVHLDAGDRTARIGVDAPGNR